MGVPFNFTCSGVGQYICSRCGNELFSTDDKVRKHDTPFPISFSKPIADNSVVKIRQPTPPPRRNALNRLNNSEADPSTAVACGKCGVKIGICQGSNGQNYFDIDWKSLLFVPTKQCSIPWSFLL